MKDITNNIRKNNYIKLTKSIIANVICGGGCILSFYGAFSKKFKGEFLIIGIPLLLFFVYSIKQTIDCIKLIINPFKDDVFKKYGSAEKIAQIYDEIEKTTEFKHNSIMVSKNFLCDPKNASKLVAFNDILAVHKTVQRVNLQVDCYAITVTDKYGEIINFIFKRNEEALVDSLIQTIATKTPNAEIGYTSDAFDHIKQNKIPLTQNLSPDNSIAPQPFVATFKSDEQRHIEQIEAVKRQNTFKNFGKFIGCIALSMVSSEMLLMIILGDSVRGATALILLFIVAIPFFILYYFFFIGRKNKLSRQQPPLVQDNSTCFCSNCGAKINKNNLFCTQCGTKR